MNSFFLNILLLTCVISLLVPNNASRILGFFPVPSRSHQVVYRTLMHELARRGHEVVIITTDPASQNETISKKFSEIDLHDVSYEFYNDNVLKHLNGTLDPLDVLRIIFTSFTNIFALQLRTKEVQEIMNDGKHFDLIITHMWVRVALVLSHVFKAPLIQMSTLGAAYLHLKTVGVPFHPIYTPTCIRTRLYDLSIWEKVQAIYEEYQIHDIMSKLEDHENNMITNLFGPNMPSVYDLSENVAMLFLNVHPLWADKQAVPPGVVYLGGLHQQKEKPLPQELLSFIEKSKHGVIYMSFGSQIRPSRLPDEQLKVFRRVFSKLPYDILWKWDEDTMANKTKNIRISKWLPQSDLLRHPNIKLFITHAGLQSTDEALTAGVPLLAFPLFGDQFYNAEKYLFYKIGLSLDIETVTEEILEQSIQSVIENSSYRENSKLLGMMMRDEPQTSLERAVWWTEYVLRHRGAKHLRSPLANLSWSEYLMLDVLALVILILLFTILIIYFITKKVANILMKCLSSKKKIC